MRCKYEINRNTSTGCLMVNILLCLTEPRPGGIFCLFADCLVRGRLAADGRFGDSAATLRHHKLSHRPAAAGHAAGSHQN